jgi:8-oxo-dGTP diphosphatase
MNTAPAHIAIGVIFDQQQKILVALRPEDKLQGGVWEFPGGKVEQGESVEQALNRELLEEVGISVKQAQPLIQCDYRYKDHHVYLDVWCVTEFVGAAHGKEGQPIKWVSLQQLQKLPMLQANHPIVEALLK